MIDEKLISPFIAQQFPSFYKEEGPVFVEFCRKYYEWAESSNNFIYHSRRMQDYSDVDLTVEEFLVHFKSAYLTDIQLETTTDTRRMVKHALDLYRSKGSERAIDLLFRLVFGVGADVYYPRDDLFSLSSGKWRRPRYLEVAIDEANDRFVGKQVIGQKSGAIAFCEKLVRRKTRSKILDILYISAVEGEFETGERINFTTSPDSWEECPKIVGSLTTLVVVDGSKGYVNGDLVELTSSQGRGGKARVVSTFDQTGVVDFKLVDGGWGYSQYANVLISERVLTVANVMVGNVIGGTDYFYLFDKLVQPTANIHYISATGSFEVGDDIYTYWGNTSVRGHGVVMEVSPVDANSGHLRLSIRSGNCHGVMYTTGNTVQANQAVLDGYTNTTAVANVIGVHSNVFLTVTALSNTFTLGEEVYQNVNAINAFSNGKVYSIEGDASVSRFGVTNSYSVFTANDTLVGVTSNSTAHIDGVTIAVGVKDIQGEFLTLPGAWVYATDPEEGVTGSNTQGLVTLISNGVGASVNISTDFSYSEEDEICLTPILPFMNVALDATVYGAPMEDPSANLSSIISDGIDYEIVEFGKIQALVSPIGGHDYNAGPIVRVMDAAMYSYRKTGYRLRLANATASFAVGEIVQQGEIGARGIFKFANSAGYAWLDRISFKEFVETTNSSTGILGLSSGTTASVLEAAPTNRARPEYDIAGENAGLSALITGTPGVAAGAVTELEVVDSGFGFYPGEGVTFTTSNHTPGRAEGFLGHSGRGFGQYLDRNGFLSDSKKLQDGDYWQEFSYEVRSSVALDKYAQMLKKVVHTAGMKFFGDFRNSSVIDGTTSTDGASITQA